MFRKVLVANRGEIAVRVIRALRELGVGSVAVYSDPDRDAPHVRLADEAHALPGVSSRETYLDQEKLLAVARKSGAEAVHPGYGFLSENASFAERVEAAGLKLVGPSARVIRAMGDKLEARRTMEKAGVPVIPGWELGVRSSELGVRKGRGAPHSPPLTPHSAAQAAAEIGYPLLVKAVAGGGGKGMRRVADASGLEAALEAAAREAEQAFGDGRVYLEKYLARPRHVEVQIFGDAHGNAVHLFERECSIQRRHQKIVEESPSPALEADLRARMGEAAVQAAQAIGYENAGTVEFLLDGERNFYFLEVNTRLQVEHPVTELVTGRDLVRAQLRVAAGEPLPFRQEDLRQTGHAIEVRVYAEDPEQDFLPGTGLLQVYREPSGPGVRVDSGVRQGSEVSVHYDPLLAKLVVWGEDRAHARARLEQALAEYVALGVRTNIGFLRRVIAHPAFRAGELHTHFLEEHDLSAAPGELPPEALAAAALALAKPAFERSNAQTFKRSNAPSPWLEAGPWRLE